MIPGAESLQLDYANSMLGWVDESCTGISRIINFCTVGFLSQSLPKIIRNGSLDLRFATPRGTEIVENNLSSNRIVASKYDLSVVQGSAPKNRTPISFSEGGGGGDSTIPIYSDNSGSKIRNEGLFYTAHHF